ncbi:hypothetical protein K435DRAFT_929258, partial [Dendrothele bispora CBS 962.96]
GEFPFRLEMNSGKNLGIGWQVSSISNGSQSSSATSYFEPFMNRTNLDVLLNTRVIRIVSDDTGDEVDSGCDSLSIHTVEIASSADDTPTTLTASNELILSSGAIDTPQILMLSGIGDPSSLSSPSLNISTILANPSVGQNLSDHPAASRIWRVNSTEAWEAFASTRNFTGFDSTLEEWENERKGPFSDALFNQLGWLRLNESDPDVTDALREFGDPAAGPNTAHFELLFSVSA